MKSRRPVYYSTHNVLRDDDAGDDLVRVSLVSLEGRHVTEVTVLAFQDVETIKRRAYKSLNLPVGCTTKDIRILHRGTELHSGRQLLQLLDKNQSKLRLEWTLRETDTQVEAVRTVGFKTTKFLQNIIRQVDFGFSKGIPPRLTLDGTGGTYLLPDGNGQYVAVFKPRDEEPFAPNNPRDYEGVMGQAGFRPGVKSGEGALREVAAFVLDAVYGNFAGVPHTAKVEACHAAFNYKATFKGKTQARYAYAQERLLPSGEEYRWKEGSLQEFVANAEPCSDYSETVFSIADVHRIGILDIRVMNLDRNDGNILVVPVCDSLKRPSYATKDNSDATGPDADERFLEDAYEHSSIYRPWSPEEHLTIEGKPSKFRLVPIDHGLILPDVMDLCYLDVVWSRWPQSIIPFGLSELQYIFMIDPDRDAVNLCACIGISDECLRIMRVSTRVLQIGTRMHLNLRQILKIVTRDGSTPAEPSVLERLVRVAMEQAYRGVDATSLMQQNRFAYMMDLAMSAHRRHFALGNTVLPASSKVKGKGDAKLSRKEKRKASSRKVAGDSNVQIESSAVRAEEEEKISKTDFESMELLEASVERQMITVAFSGPSGEKDAALSEVMREDLDEQLKLTEKRAARSTSWERRLTYRNLQHNNSSEQGKAMKPHSEGRLKPRTLRGKGVRKRSEALHSGGSMKGPNSHSSDNDGFSTSEDASDVVGTLPTESESDASSTTEEDAYDDGEGAKQRKGDVVEVPLVSRITGVPLEFQRVSRPPAIKSLDGSISTSQSEFVLGKRKASYPLAALGRLPIIDEEILSASGAGDLRKQMLREGTARKRQTAMRRATTPMKHETLWTIVDDRGHQVTLDWDDKLFDSLFHSIFEQLVVQHIRESHPDWRSYEYYGNELESLYFVQKSTAPRWNPLERHSTAPYVGPRNTEFFEVL